MKVIAFGHRKGVGKDTCARFVRTVVQQSCPGCNIQTVGFADKLKEMCYGLYGWAGIRPGFFYEEEGRHLKDVVLPKLGKSPRQVWIEFGNNLRRIYDPTWAHYVFHNCRCDLLIIKDLRFETEANYIREFGGLVFRVDRPSAPKVTDGADEVLANYPDWDDVVPNDGTHGELFNRIQDLCRRFLGDVESRPKHSR